MIPLLRVYHTEEASGRYLRDTLATTQVIFEHLLTIEGHTPKDLSRFAPAGFSLARTMQRAIDNRPFISNRDCTETWITFQRRIDTHQTIDGHDISCLFLSLPQDTALYRFAIVYNTTRNSISQAIRT